jgi:hypothetical protein
MPRSAARHCAGASLAGDDEHELRPLRLIAVQEVQQGIMGLRLRHAVEIDASADLGLAARELLFLPPRDRDRRCRRLGMGGGRGRMIRHLFDRPRGLRRRYRQGGH